MTTDYEPIVKLTKDLANAAKTLTPNEARFLVDAYYQMQDNRIRAAGQLRALTQSDEPVEILDWLFEQSFTLEKQVKRALGKYVDGHVAGEWLTSVHGIGPVLAAGLTAHIDIHKAPTAGHIWAFAGLDPTKTWSKGEKLPWNASLKTLCWKIGESFVKVSGNEDAFYGRIYGERKQLETERNEAGAYAAQAKRILETRKIGKSTDAYRAYSNGKLPPAHIHARAKRYAVKLFLAHLHEVWRKAEGLDVPNPYPIAILGHAHKIEPPHLAH